jgi:hypothetical protein
MKTIQNEAAIMQEIMKLTGVTEMEYKHALLHSGANYILKVAKTEEMANSIADSRVFWIFYRNQFLLIDKALIEKPEIPVSPKTLVLNCAVGVKTISMRSYWELLHNPDSIVAYPGKEVWADINRITELDKKTISNKNQNHK